MEPISLTHNNNNQNTIEDINATNPHSNVIKIDIPASQINLRKTILQKKLMNREELNSIKANTNITNARTIKETLPNKHYNDTSTTLNRSIQGAYYYNQQLNKTRRQNRKIFMKRKVKKIYEREPIDKRKCFFNIPFLPTQQMFMNNSINNINNNVSNNTNNTHNNNTSNNQMRRPTNPTTTNNHTVNTNIINNTNNQINNTNTNSNQVNTNQNALNTIKPNPNTQKTQNMQNINTTTNNTNVNNNSTTNPTYNLNKDPMIFKIQQERIEKEIADLNIEKYSSVFAIKEMEELRAMVKKSKDDSNIIKQIPTFISALLEKWDKANIQYVNQGVIQNTFTNSSNVQFNTNNTTVQFKTSNNAVNPNNNANSNNNTSLYSFSTYPIFQITNKYNQVINNHKFPNNLKSISNPRFTTTNSSISNFYINNHNNIQTPSLITNNTVNSNEYFDTAKVTNDITINSNENIDTAKVTNDITVETINHENTNRDITTEIVNYENIAIKDTDMIETQTNLDNNIEMTIDVENNNVKQNTNKNNNIEIHTTESNIVIENNTINSPTRETIIKSCEY